MDDIVKVEIEKNRFVLRSKVSENPKFVQNMDYDVTMFKTEIRSKHGLRRHNFVEIFNIILDLSITCFSHFSGC